MKPADFKLTTKYRIQQEIKNTKNPRSIFLVTLAGQTETLILKKWRLKDPNDLSEVYEFLNIQQELHHPQIMRVLEWFKTDTEVQFIFTQAPGKPLLKYFKKESKISELDLGRIAVQLVILLNFIHERNICIRALDPDNIFYDGKQIYLTNFLLAKYRRTRSFRDYVGEFYLMSPEMANIKYGRSNDIWQAGVILHVIATGYPVIEAETLIEAQTKFRKNDFDIDKFKVLLISEELKDVIVNMLNPHYKSRKKASELCKMKMVTDFTNQSGPVFQRPSLFENKLGAFSLKNKFHKAMHQFLVKQSSTQEEKSNALNEFRQLDLNGNGVLNKEEIRTVLERMGEANVDRKLDKIMEKMGSQNKDQIKYEDFLQMWVDMNVFYQEERLQKYFRLLDLNGNGLISEDELLSVFGDAVRTREYQDVLVKYTQNRQIDFPNFVRMIKDMQAKGP